MTIDSKVHATDCRRGYTAEVHFRSQPFKIKSPIFSSANCPQLPMVLRPIDLEYGMVSRRLFVPRLRRHPFGDGLHQIGAIVNQRKQFRARLDGQVERLGMPEFPNRKTSMHFVAVG